MTCGTVGSVIEPGAALELVTCGLVNVSDAGRSLKRSLVLVFALDFRILQRALECLLLSDEMIIGGQDYEEHYF